MAIQMRRGLRKDFDPNKMLPGEWAVSIDSVTSNQIVWMCFAAGICKRMGTYEDFQAQIAEATKDIRDSYVEDFNEIKADIELMSNAVSSDKEEILIIKSDIVDKYLPQMQEYAERAEGAASSSETFAINAENSATLSKSYAVGGTGTREGENADNAKYYYEQAKHISQGGNGLVPKGTIAFEDIPTSDIATNAMYNINNDFTSDERFVDGGGVLYGKGSNIFYTVDGLWDVLAASDVKGVKGAAEDTYRQGNVNITPANIGSPTTEEFNELSKTVGNTDISDVAGGTVTSAIRELVDNPSDTSIWISQSDYDALSEEEKNSDTSYYIYDADSNDNAYTVPFTSEKYEAENVGDALNEAKSNLDNIGFENPTFSFNENAFPFTATKSGIATVIVIPKTSTEWSYCYIQDSKGYNMGRGHSEKGGHYTLTFPIRKGETYKTLILDNYDSVTLSIYPFTFN